MFKAIAIGALMMLAQSLRIAEHEAYVYDKNGNLAYETNMAPKTDQTYAGPGAVSLSICGGKPEGSECSWGGKCLVCGGVMQCRYWGKC